MKAIANYDDFTILHDENMGRVLTSKKSYVVGDILWQENTFIYSSNSFQDMIEPHNELIEMAFQTEISDNISVILNELTELNQIKSLDTAKNFLLLLAITILRSASATKDNDIHQAQLFTLLHKCDNNTLSSYSSSHNDLNIQKNDQYDEQDHQLKDVTNSSYIQSKLALLDQLTCHHLDECMADIQFIRDQYPSLIPTHITDETAGRLIGILNTNQVELETRGSALFPFTSILQHNCHFNCSFNTHGNTLYMVANKDISPNDRLSIDYGDHLYRPTSERQIHLLDTYGFLCQCSMCVGEFFRD